MATKRRFTDEQKLEILQEAEKRGITVVLREHSLSYSVFAKWREKFAERNMDDAQGMILANKTKSELKQFIEENTRLKKIIADQALELERKDEVLKKNNPLYNKR
jgi:putative transposase